MFSGRIACNDIEVSLNFVFASGFWLAVQKPSKMLKIGSCSDFRALCSGMNPVPNTLFGALWETWDKAPKDRFVRTEDLRIIEGEI